MNREKAIRYKFYELLTAQPITYDLGDVSIWDEKAEDTTNNLYIIMGRQTASADETYCNNKWTCRIDLRIIDKQTDTMSKDVPDDISEQVENALLPLIPGVEYEGWSLTNVVLENVEYDPFFLTTTESEIEKTLTYRLTAQKL